MEKNKRGVVTLTAEEAASAEWEISERSGPWTDNCVEVAAIVDPLTKEVGAYAVRNSRDPEGPMVVFDPGEWAAFVGREDATFPA